MNEMELRVEEFDAAIRAYTRSGQRLFWSVSLPRPSVMLSPMMAQVR
jgi:hypothetical protein